MPRAGAEKRGEPAAGGETLADVRRTSRAAQRGDLAGEESADADEGRRQKPPEPPRAAWTGPACGVDARGRPREGGLGGRGSVEGTAAPRPAARDAGGNSDPTLRTARAVEIYISICIMTPNSNPRSSQHDGVTGAGETRERERLRPCPGRRRTQSAIRSPRAPATGRARRRARGHGGRRVGPRAGRGAAHARSEPSTRCGEPPGPEHLRSEGGPTRRASGGPPRERWPQRHTSSCVCVSRTSFSDEATPAADRARDGSRESQRASGPRPPPRRALQPFASPRGRGRGEGQAGTRSWGQRGRTFREKAHPARGDVGV